MKTVAIIQARMGSTRLPGKVLIDICGEPMLYWVVSRTQRARTLNLAVVATSDNPVDDVICYLCAQWGIPCFRGAEDDVLDRYYRAAIHFDAEAIVRLTADCPLLDPLVIDEVVRVFREGEFDYVSNTLECTYPDGLDTEVFGRAALNRAWHEACLKSEREHVTAYIYRHRELFRLGNVKNKEDLSALRWTVDEPRDLEFVRTIYSHLGTSPFGMPEILNLLGKHPELGGLNADIKRNEGYQKSLAGDALFPEKETG